MGYLSGIPDDVTTVGSRTFQTDFVPPTTSQGWRDIAEVRAREKKFHDAGWALWNAQQMEEDEHFLTIHGYSRKEKLRLEEETSAKLNRH